MDYSREKDDVADTTEKCSLCKEAEKDFPVLGEDDEWGTGFLTYCIERAPPNMPEEANTIEMSATDSHDAEMHLVRNAVNVAQLFVESESKDRKMKKLMNAQFRAASRDEKARIWKAYIHAVGAEFVSPYIQKMTLEEMLRSLKKISKYASDFEEWIPDTREPNDYIDYIYRMIDFMATQMGVLPMNEEKRLEWEDRAVTLNIVNLLLWLSENLVRGSYPAKIPNEVQILIRLLVEHDVSPWNAHDKVLFMPVSRAFNHYPMYLRIVMASCLGLWGGGSPTDVFGYVLGMISPKKRAVGAIMSPGVKFLQLMPNPSCNINYHAFNVNTIGEEREQIIPDLETGSVQNLNYDTVGIVSDFAMRQEARKTDFLKDKMMVMPLLIEDDDAVEEYLSASTEIEHDQELCKELEQKVNDWMNKPPETGEGSTTKSTVEGAKKAVNDLKEAWEKEDSANKKPDVVLQNEGAEGSNEVIEQFCRALNGPASTDEYAPMDMAEEIKLEKNSPPVVVGNT